MTLHQGRFGPYVRHGRDNASLRKGHDPAQLTLEQAVQLLRRARRQGQGPGEGGEAGAGWQDRECPDPGQGGGARLAPEPAAKRARPATRAKAPTRRGTAGEEASD